MIYPHFHKSNEVLVHTFIKGLDPNTKILLDSAAIGQALEKTYDKLYTLLNRISQGNPKWNGGGLELLVHKWNRCDDLSYFTDFFKVEYDEHTFLQPSIVATTLPR